MNHRTIIGGALLAMAGIGGPVTYVAIKEQRAATRQAQFDSCATQSNDAYTAQPLNLNLILINAGADNSSTILDPETKTVITNLGEEHDLYADRPVEMIDFNDPTAMLRVEPLPPKSELVAADVLNKFRTCRGIDLG